MTAVGSSSKHAHRCPRRTSTQPLGRPGETDLYRSPMTDTPVATDVELAEVIDLLDDEHVRTILTATSAEPLSAQELSDRCDLSVSAIYRRVEQLEAAGLLEEGTRPRRDGHHDTVYVATLETFELTIRDGDLTWTVDRTDTDIADELTRLWREF